MGEESVVQCGWCGLHGGEHERDCGKPYITYGQYEARKAASGDE